MASARAPARPWGSLLLVLLLSWQCMIPFNIHSAVADGWDGEVERGMKQAFSSLASKADLAGVRELVERLRGEVEELKGVVASLEGDSISAVGVVSPEKAMSDSTPGQPTPPSESSAENSDTVPRVDSERSHYLLYDVNTQEGFNLRRDVLLRIMMLMKLLNDAPPPAAPLQAPAWKWTLVLPPFIRLVHWDYDAPPVLSWDRFFDVNKLREFIPVLTYPEFLEILSKEQTPGTADGTGQASLHEVHGVQIDRVIHLKSKPFDNNRPRQYPFDIVPCKGHNLSPPGFPWYQGSDGKWVSTISAYRGSCTGNVSCASVFHSYSHLVPLLQKAALAWESGFRLSLQPGFKSDLHEVDAKVFAFEDRAARGTTFSDGVLDNPRLHTVLIERFENMFWDGHFGQKLYWDARRHIKWAPHLVNFADGFIASRLSGPGNYIGVHLRRRDFLYARGEDIPELSEVIKKLRNLMAVEGVSKIFLATDAPEAEYAVLERELPVVSYRFSEAGKDTDFHDGEVAIIDQYVCVKSKFFIGTIESTFSHVIMQEREVQEYDPDKTYNMFCRTADVDCGRPGRFPLVG